MNKEMFIASSPHETKVAVCEDGQVVEVYFERDTDVGLVGGIYKGRVNRVLPGMQSAFVDIGLERDAFLYVSDFFEDSEEYDKVVSEAEARVSRYTGGGVVNVGAAEASPAATVQPAPAEPGALVAPVLEPAASPAESATFSGPSGSPAPEALSETGAPSGNMAVSPSEPGRIGNIFRPLWLARSRSAVRDRCPVREHGGIVERARI